MPVWAGETFGGWLSARRLRQAGRLREDEFHRFRCALVIAGVELGILLQFLKEKEAQPGGGGTQRLPRLAGLQNAAMLAFSPNPRPYPAILREVPYSFGGVIVTNVKLTIFGVAIALCMPPQARYEPAAAALRAGSASRDWVAP